MLYNTPMTRFLDRNNAKYSKDQSPYNFIFKQDELVKQERNQLIVSTVIYFVSSSSSF